MNTRLTRFTVREALGADLPLLARWLPPQPAAPALPEVAHEHLLVALDATGSVRATLRLVPAIGLTLPRPSYRVGLVVHAAAELGLFHQQATLLLGHDLTGAAELADAADDGQLTAAEEAAAWQVLLDAALARIAAVRGAYGPRLVAELPGVRDAAGQSPFWQGLGRHFFAGDPATAQAQHGPAWVSHAAALMPRQPLLAGFLPEAAQAAIGRAAESAAVLHQVLKARGLRWQQQVRIDDAGPVLEADLEALL
jgi:arginine/ornithine succinyltransferase subunit-like protein